MAKMDLQVGDLIVLKSGGPVMTVVWAMAGPPDQVRGGWFCDNQFMEQEFPRQAVNRAPESCGVAAGEQAYYVPEMAGGES